MRRRCKEAGLALEDFGRLTAETVVNDTCNQLVQQFHDYWPISRGFALWALAIHVRYSLTTWFEDFINTCSLVIHILQPELQERGLDFGWDYFPVDLTSIHKLGAIVYGDIEP